MQARRRGRAAPGRGPARDTEESNRGLHRPSRIWPLHAPDLVLVEQNRAGITKWRWGAAGYPAYGEWIALG